MPDFERGTPVTVTFTAEFQRSFPSFSNPQQTRLVVKVADGTLVHLPVDAVLEPAGDKADCGCDGCGCQ